jgi:hypothetical protein
VGIEVAGILTLCRTAQLQTGVRGVLYLPGGRSVHTLEDDPIPPGVYFMRPDQTGRHTHFVVERVPGSRVAVPAVIDDQGREVAPARTSVEWHLGNSLRDSRGCAMPGLATTPHGLVDSGTAMEVMRAALHRDDPNPPAWVLEIRQVAA